MRFVYRTTRNILENGLLKDLTVILNGRMINTIRLMTILGELKSRYGKNIQKESSIISEGVPLI